MINKNTSLLDNKSLLIIVVYLQKKSLKPAFCIQKYAFFNPIYYKIYIDILCY